MSDGGWRRLLTIVEEDAVQETVERCRNDENLNRFGEAYDGLTWLMARKGLGLGVSQRIDDRVFRLYTQDPDYYAETPRITVVYECLEDKLVLHDIKVEKPPDETDDD